MFVAVELSSGTPEPVGTMKRGLFLHLRSLEAHPDLLVRAFPADDWGTFMDAFMRVVSMERGRIDPTSDELQCNVTDPRQMHQPRHDVESFFWVLDWILLRASARCNLAESISGSADRRFSKIADLLLDHTIGDEFTRNMLRVHAREYHPLLRHLAPGLPNLSTYASIPWHLYTTTMPEMHAHTAFRGMLLTVIHKLSTDSASNNACIDVDHPGNMIWVDLWNITPRKRSSSTTGTGSMSASQRRLKRRDRDFDSNDMQRPAKRAKLDHCGTLDTDRNRVTASGSTDTAS
ncbi:hypothetical protein AURDEDRAFT_167171 [Auricularia subglabra TFB-10046 SS5]|nr:hypothetical protein AURDEDRAFT_167171 [Auricularia subglabra TFB-10046 SS5]